MLATPRSSCDQGAVKRKVRAALVVASVFAAIGIETACSNQGEGEVCNVANGSDDCETGQGLVCYDARQLNFTTSDRCCPADRSKSTHPTCVTSTSVVGSDAAAPAETGPTVTQDAQVTDASSTDATDADAQP